VESEIENQIKEADKQVNVDSPSIKRLQVLTKVNVKAKSTAQADQEEEDDDKNDLAKILSLNEDNGALLNTDDQHNVLPESLMMNDLNEIADKSVDEIDQEEAMHENPDSNHKDDPESELQFLSHDVADFIRSTNDIQRLRSDIMENERRNRLTSGY
jgi:hypothetical protein